MHSPGNIEQGTVGTAHDPAPIRIQVSVLAPSHRRTALVRARIAPRVQLIAPSYDEKRVESFAQRIAAARLAFGKLIQSAQRDIHERHRRRPQREDPP
jgi:hypothetical protein